MKSFSSHLKVSIPYTNSTSDNMIENNQISSSQFFNKTDFEDHLFQSKMYPKILILLSKKSKSSLTQKLLSNIKINKIHLSSLSFGFQMNWSQIWTLSMIQRMIIMTINFTSTISIRSFNSSKTFLILSFIIKLTVLEKFLKWLTN